MPTISSRLSIPLLLVIFVALAIPPTARAATVLPGAEDCAWWNAACRNRNYEAGFNPAGTARRLPSAPTPAPASAPSSVLPVDNVAPTPTRDPAVPSWAANLSAEQFYEKVSLPCRNLQGWTCDDEKQRLFYQSGGKSITPTAVEPKDNWDLQGTREPLDNWDLQGTREPPIDEAIQQYRAGERASYNSNPLPTTDAIQQYRAQERALYNAAPSANVEPKDNWDLQGSREPLDNWDLQGRAPSTRALTPWQRYQSQFNNASERPTGDSSTKTTLTDPELQRIGRSCAEDASAGPYQQCIMNTVNSLQGGITPADALRVQQYVQSQESSAQTTVRDSAPAYVSPYNDSRDPSGFYTFMDNCDKEWGAGTADSNICKEPILREMGISGSAQAQTPPNYYGQYAPVEDYSRPASYEDVARFNEQSDQPKTYATGIGWWDKYILRIPDTRTSSRQLVASPDGGVAYEQPPALVEERWTSTPRPYTREEEDALSRSRITITAEDTIFTSSESSSGEFVTPGWMTRFKNWFTGDNTEPEQQYRSYVDRDTEYQTLGDGSTVLISTLGDEEYYYDDLGPLPYEPPAPAQYGTFVGPDSYCANEDCSVLINYTDEQPGSYGYDSDVNSATFVPDTVLEPDTVPEPDSTADTGMDPPMWSVKFYDEESDSMIDTAPEGSGGWWNLWNSWDSSETQARPTRQFSTAVPFSGELFNQSLAAGAFGAFLLKNKQKDAPARTAREPFGNGL